MNPALAELVRVLAEAAVEDYVAELEADECEDRDDEDDEAA